VITSEQIARVLGVPVFSNALRRKSKLPALAPGLLDRHYSPLKPLCIHRRVTEAMVTRAGSDDAWICFRKPTWAGKAKNVFWLSKSGDVPAAGRRLFSLLRRLDAGACMRLHAELAPAGGPGLAINDRLRRTAAK
jgi:L-threonylcarbamoyladenylate synthase